MYQLMIVEDELWMRRGLEQILDWDQLNINCVKSAKNGKEALELMDDFNADIILTDIKMPIIDGLSMMDAIAEKNDKVPKVIVISGYNDFDFAKRAIKHGAVDYILKPVDANELSEAILKAIYHISQEKKYALLTLNIELKNIIYEHIFFYSNHLISNEAILEDYFFGVVLSPTTIDTLIEQFLDDDVTYVSLPIGLYHFNVIVSLDKNKLLSSIEQLSKYPHHGISNIQSNIERNFLVAYNEAELDFQTKYYQENVSLNFQDLNIILARADEERISKALHSKDKKEVKKIISGLLEKCSNLESKLLMQFQVFIFLTRYLNNNQLSLYNVTRTFYQYRFVQTIEDLDKLYDSTFEPLIEGIINNFQAIKVNYVSLVKDKIEANYHDSTLSLERVAESLNLSPAYLSYIIKKETNINFIMHVKNKRVETAKALLVNSNLPVYKVSVKVGYNDVKYFIRVFKKETGLTPNQYRELFSLDSKRWK